MAAGTLRHKMKIQRRQTLQDDYHDGDEVWVDVATVNAGWEPRSGTEIEHTKQMHGRTSSRIRFRWAPSIRDHRHRAGRDIESGFSP